MLRGEIVQSTPGSLAVASLLMVVIPYPVCFGQRGDLPMLSGDAIVLQNRFCRYEIGVDGTVRAFIDRSAGKDYAEQGQSFLAINVNEKTLASTKVKLDGGLATVSFGDSPVQVQVRLGAHPTHLSLTVEKVVGDDVEWVQLCGLRLQISENVGPLVNAAWNDTFGVCVLACNDRTHSYGADGSQTNLCARCYQKYGLEGARIAILGTPTGPPDPAAHLLDAIGEVEMAEGLPHPILNGVWIKKASERFASYLMVHDCGEENIDQVLEFARGGFGCIEIYPWRSTATYGLNPSLFPNGMAGLKALADKVHAAGLQLGIHTMQAMVGWGRKDDPYISPKADPRLLQDRHATLAAPLDEKATEVSVRESVADWPEQGDLYLKGEIIRYGRHTDNTFADCQRGLHKTTVTAHSAGATVGHLVNCFPLWGHTVYCPDLATDMVDEICARIAEVFNEVGADMSYFDGGEELLKQPPHWRNQGRVALGVMQRLKKPVVLEGNALYTHLAWHVITRGSPHFDPIYFGRRDYTLRFKGQKPAQWAKNLLTGDVGWFAPHTHSPTTDAVTPDELMLLCLKALGSKAPISFIVDARNMWANKRMPEMLDIIRACDELKRQDYFTEAACAELARPMVEHLLEQTPGGEWRLRPLQFAQPHVVNSDQPDTVTWRYENAHTEQRPWVRLRGRTQLAPYGDPDNIVLANFTGDVPFAPDGTSSPDLTQSVERTDERAPDGASAFCYRAENSGSATSAWTRLSLKLPKPLDLTAHRRLGLWLHSDGQGGLLNLQLAGKDARRDHYVMLDFTGWRYLILDPPEDSRLWDYKWPYSWTDLLYTCWPVYSATTDLVLYYNALPPEAKVATLVGRIEALAERPLPLKSPALEVASRRLTFPVALKPDEYLELDWNGRCRHFSPNGDLLGEVKPEGRLYLAPSHNTIRFTCAQVAEGSHRGEVTLATRGDPLPNARRPGAHSTGVRYPSLMASGN